MWHTAYWPWPPRLLDVAALAAARRDERLPQRRPAGLGLDRRRCSARAAGSSSDVDVGLAHGPEHDLVGLGVVLERMRQVLGDEPLQGAGQLVLVGLGRGAGSRRAAAARAAPRASTTAGRSLAESVSDVSARRELGDRRTMSPAIASGLARSVVDDGRGRAARRARRRRGRRGPRPRARRSRRGGRTRARPRRRAGCRRRPAPGDAADVGVGRSCAPPRRRAGRPGRSAAGGSAAAGRGDSGRAAGARVGCGKAARSGASSSPTPAPVGGDSGRTG